MLRISSLKVNNIRNMSRIFAISDLHVDMPQNRQWVKDKLCSGRYKNDVLIVAGDITDNICLLKETLSELVKAFSYVCYVPGNHELWLRSSKSSSYIFENSIQKLNKILELCNDLGVQTKPIKIQCCNETYVWVVPILSWYTQPEEDRKDSLFIDGRNENYEKTQSLWMDNHLCKWPNTQTTISKYFENLNTEHVSKTYDSPVITFSHFLPRQELIVPTEDEIKRVDQERKALGLVELDTPRLQGATVGFNFSRYAGCSSIERQIRTVGSKVHLHGHQHRNRNRIIDGVQYISFCLGYPRERSQGLMWGLSKIGGPKQVWPQL